MQTNQPIPPGIKEVYETTDTNEVNSYLKHHWIRLRDYPNDEGKIVYVLGCLPEGETRGARTVGEIIKN